MKTCRTAVVPVCSLSILAALWPTSLSARGDIFVTNGQTLAGYTTTGTKIFSTQSSVSDLAGLAVSGSDLFVVHYSSCTVSEYTTSGTLLNASLISGLSSPFNIAVSGSNLFIANRGHPGQHDGTIGEYTISGATVNPALVSGLDTPAGIVVSGSNIFVANDGDGTTASGSLGAYTTSGATVNASLVSGLNLGSPNGLAISGQDLFVATSSSLGIGEYSTSGVTVNESLISGSLYYGIAASGPGLFVAFVGNGQVCEYDAGTGAPISAPLATGVYGIIDMAVSADVPEPTSILPLACGAGLLLRRRGRPGFRRATSPPPV